MNLYDHYKAVTCNFRLYHQFDLHNHKQAQRGFRPPVNKCKRMFRENPL